MPPPFAEALGPGLRQPHPQFDAVVERHDIERFDIFSGLHDAFAEAEADGEIPEVPGRPHHHRIGAAIIGQRQRGFFRDGARALADAVIAPDQTIDRANRIVHRLFRRFHHRRDPA